MDHHCCDPGHRDHDDRHRRLVDRLHSAEARARFAEVTEAVMAATVARLRQQLSEKAETEEGVPDLANLLVPLRLPDDNAREVVVEMPPDVRSALRERLDRCEDMLRAPKRR